MKRIVTGGCISAVWTITALTWAAPIGAAQEAVPLQPLIACREIADDADRLACFDAAVAAIAGDEVETGERLVVVDLDDAEAIERDGFGLNLPSLPRLSLSILAARGGEDLNVDRPQGAASAAQSGERGSQAGAAEAPRVLERDDDGSIEQIEFTVAEVRSRGYSTILVEMTNGQVWSISEGRNLDLLPRRVRAGTPAVIRRAALDSYLLQFEGRGTAYRVTRTR
jgi:hypothetical protein